MRPPSTAPADARQPCDPLAAHGMAFTLAATGHAGWRSPRRRPGARIIQRGIRRRCLAQIRDGGTPRMRRRTGQRCGRARRISRRQQMRLACDRSVQGGCHAVSERSGTRASRRSRCGEAAAHDAARHDLHDGGGVSALSREGALAGRWSPSATRRLRPIQAAVRSAIQRFGSTTKRCRALGRAISVVRPAVQASTGAIPGRWYRSGARRTGTAASLAQQPPGSAAILPISRMHTHRWQSIDRFDRHVAPAADDALARVVAGGIEPEPRFRAAFAVRPSVSTAVGPG